MMGSAVSAQCREVTNFLPADVSSYLSSFAQLLAIDDSEGPGGLARGSSLVEPAA